MNHPILKRNPNPKPFSNPIHLYLSVTHPEDAPIMLKLDFTIPIRLLSYCLDLRYNSIGVWKQIVRFFHSERSSSQRSDLLKQLPSSQTSPPNQLTSPHLGQLKIPTEIIQMITKNLDKLSLLCFTLTCQTLKCYYFPKTLNLSSSEQPEFLLLLGKDAAKYYFCHFCVKLHPWYAYWFDDSHHPSSYFYTKHGDHCRMMNWFSHFSLSIT